MGSIFGGGLFGGGSGVEHDEDAMSPRAALLTTEQGVESVVEAAHPDAVDGGVALGNARCVMPHIKEDVHHPPHLMPSTAAEEGALPAHAVSSASAFGLY